MDIIGSLSIDNTTSSINKSSLVAPIRRIIEIVLIRMMVKRRSYKSFNFVEVFLNIIKNKISAFFITADSKSKTPVQQMDAKKIPVTGKLNFFISFYNLTEEKNIFIKIRIRTPDKAYSSEAKLDDLKRKLQHITEMHFTLNSALFKTA